MVGVTPLRRPENDRRPSIKNRIQYSLLGRSNGVVLTFINNPFILSPVWSSFVTRLAREFAILTYDLRGQGASPDFGDPGHPSHVEDLAEVHRRLGVQRSYVIGTSFSTLVAREYALSYPQHLAGLVLVNPVFNPYGARRRRAMARSWLATLKSGGLPGLFDHLFPLLYTERTIETGGSAMYLVLRERFIAMNSELGFRTMLESSLRVDDDPRRLRDISCPTLMIAGEADFFSDPQSVEVLARLIAHGRSETIRGGGHLLYMDSTDAFEARIAQFVREVERANGERPDRLVSSDVR